MCAALCGFIPGFEHFALMGDSMGESFQDYS